MIIAMSLANESLRPISLDFKNSTSVSKPVDSNHSTKVSYKFRCVSYVFCLLYY